MVTLYRSGTAFDNIHATGKPARCTFSRSCSLCLLVLVWLQLTDGTSIVGPQVKQLAHLRVVGTWAHHDQLDDRGSGQSGGTVSQPNSSVQQSKSSTDDGNAGGGGQVAVGTPRPSGLAKGRWGKLSSSHNADAEKKNKYALERCLSALVCC